MNRRFFSIAGITVCLESEVDLKKVKFKSELAPFEVEEPSNDLVTMHHCFDMPEMQGNDYGVEIYRKEPWAISRKRDHWIYRNIWPPGSRPQFYHLAFISEDFKCIKIYSPPDCMRYACNDWFSLSLFPTDQIWIAPLLANRNAALLHSAAAILNGKGLLFVGHSSAGKSTITAMMRCAASDPIGGATMSLQVLCDDRNIVRLWDSGWRVHGTWCHGDIAEVSPQSAPLSAILFLEQSTVNSIEPMTDRVDVWKRLLATLIKPMVTAEWWKKELSSLEQLVNDVPAYRLQFDRSGAIVQHLVALKS